MYWVIPRYSMLSSHYILRFPVVIVTGFDGNAISFVHQAYFRVFYAFLFSLVLQLH